MKWGFSNELRGDQAGHESGQVRELRAEGPFGGSAGISTESQDLQLIRGAASPQEAAAPAQDTCIYLSSFCIISLEQITWIILEQKLNLFLS